jgi:hypothetical protein
VRRTAYRKTNGRARGHPCGHSGSVGDVGGRFPRMDHYADAVFSEPGRCWRMVQTGGVGAPTHCEEPVAWCGLATTGSQAGKRIRVWSCEGHREGVERAERVGHR